MSNDLNEIEAAVFRRVVNHFRENTEVQNIDVMKTAGFCRNCLSRWYSEIAGRDAVIKGYAFMDKEAKIPKL